MAKGGLKLENQVVELLKSGLIEKNVTFLFGAGASAPYFSSLGNFEELLSNPKLERNGKQLLKSLFYYQSIKDNIYLYRFMNNKCSCHDKKELMISIINEYSRFLHNGIEFLKVRNSRVSPKRFNLMTTNYDLFIEASMDHLLELNPRVFFNDGTNGYGKRIISTDNFNKTLLYAGVFDNYSNEMPTINLIKCHGSVNWQEHNRNNKPSKIRIMLEDNSITKINQELDLLINAINNELKQMSWLYEFDSHKKLIKRINSFKQENALIDSEGLISSINHVAENLADELSSLYEKIDDLQIVLPTKDKFQTTLIQEHFFNMLRLLSYELEKKQSLLVVFGFSFYDEHITEIIQRSLNNPTLLVIVFCFTDNDKESIIRNFNFTDNNGPVNLKFIEPKSFFIKELSEAERNEFFEDARYTVIESEGRFLQYKNVVSKLENDGVCIPVLNFSSINKLLETEIENKYAPIKINESEDIQYE